MLTQERTETTQTTQPPRRSRAVTAFAATVVIVGAAIAIWLIAFNTGAVAAEDARIEVTFTGDGASYTGDREIIEGSAEITLHNETTARMWFLAARSATDSDDLAAELEFVQEGGSAVPGARMPSGVQLLESYTPGSHTVTLVLQPGTYLFDVGFDNDEPTLVWRAGVIEVIAD